MSYLVSTTRPDILFAAHQCARVFSHHMRSHEESNKRIGRYLKCTKEKGIIFGFNPTKGIEVFADADFAGSWFSFNSHDMTPSLLRMGCIIKIEDFPICWAIKLQTEVSLCKTEAECISLSQSTIDILPIKNIIECLNQFIILDNQQIGTFSTVFEDNAWALHLTTEPKGRPRTKHMCDKHHHFRQHVKNKTIKIKAINTNDQQTDVVAKPVELDKFRKFRDLIMGW